MTTNKVKPTKQQTQLRHLAWSSSSSPRIGKNIFTPKKQKTTSYASDFSEGIFERDERSIPWLIAETKEEAERRPVPNNLPLLRSLCKGEGVLKQNKKGFIYLDIHDRFISSLIPYLKPVGLTHPERAYIPVISSKEAAFHYLDKLTKLNKGCSFEIEGLYSIKAALWSEMEQIWFFKLRSKDLESFRRGHFLLSHPKENLFHITVGIKPAEMKGLPTKKLPILRVNPAFLAA